MKWLTAAQPVNVYRRRIPFDVPPAERMNGTPHDITRKVNTNYRKRDRPKAASKNHQYEIILPRSGPALHGPFHIYGE